MDKNSEEWRRECEARFIARLHPDKRVEWLLALAEKRGAKAVAKIESDIRRLNESMREHLGMDGGRKHDNAC